MENLITDNWLPVRRASGAREMIAPWQITDQHETNPIVALDTPRADFNGSFSSACCKPLRHRQKRITKIG